MVSFAPSGLTRLFLATPFDKLRAGRGLYSGAASRLKAALLVLVVASAFAPALFAENLQLLKSITVPPNAGVQSAALSPKGDFVAAACKDGQLRVWTFPRGELRQAFDLKDQRISGVWFSSDGTLLAAGGNRGGVKIWNLPSGKLKTELNVGAAVVALAISPDRSLVAVAPAEVPAQLWDLDVGRLLTPLPAKFAGSAAVAFSPDGKWLASADEDTVIRIYEAQTGALRASSDDFTLETFAIAFSADSKYLYAGGADKTISAIDVVSGKVARAFPKQSFVVGALQVSHDGKYLAAVYFDEKGFSNPAPVMVWDLASQSVRTTVQPGFTPNGAGFLPDGRLLLTSSAEGKLQVWVVK
jgi:WD40 repeat protein